MTETLMNKIKEFLKQFEGLRLESYKDSAGKWTIGYGHLQKYQRKQVITLHQAEQLLHDDIVSRYDQLCSLGFDMLYWNDNQATAIFSLFYNIGFGNFKKSRIYKRILEVQLSADSCPFNDTDSLVGLMALDFERYCHVNSQFNQGLYNRRLAEQKLFNTPAPYSNLVTL